MMRKLYNSGPFCSLGTIGLRRAMALPYGGALRRSTGSSSKLCFHSSEGTLEPFPAYIGLAAISSEMGRVEEAHTHALEILRTAPSFSLENWSKGRPLRDAAYLEHRLAATPQGGAEVRVGELDQNTLFI